MWLAYFNINPDGDFYYEKYKNLEDEYVLFNDCESARNAVLDHLDLAIKTVNHHKAKEDKWKSEWVKDLKDWFIDIYTTVSQWDFNKYPDLHIEEDHGNPYLEYRITKVKSFDELGD